MKRGLVIFSFFIFAAAHIYLARGPIRDYSPTYDEPVHLTAGAVFWKAGEYRFNGYHHPPFGEMWSAIPLIFMNPLVPTRHEAWLSQRWTPREQYEFADLFLTKNRVPAEKMMAAGRWMQVALSCLLGAVVTFSAFTLAGAGAAVMAAFCWAGSPVFLASGTLVSTDLAFALFFFGFFVFLTDMTSFPKNIAAGICLGLAFGSKYFALSVFPIVAVLLVMEPAIRKSLRAWIVITMTGLITLALLYRFSNLDVFWNGLSALFGRSQAGRSSYFIGRHGADGWLLYFPFVFLVKTPVPLLAGTIAALSAVALRKVSLPKVLWVPPLLFFAAACISKVQIGHRHLLAIYPFLFVIIAVAVEKWLGPRRWWSVPFFLWLMAGTWSVRPNFLGYFNETIGGPANGYRYLTDSNLDWGQGLKMLAAELSGQQKANGIYLSYFGVIDPHEYGIRYLDIGSDRIIERMDDTNTILSDPSLLAISVTNLQSTYYADHAAFDWLKGKTPVKRVANSIFIYDFSNDPESLSRLRRMRA